MTLSFLYLEILDPEVNSLLWEIKEILSGSTTIRPVHLTIRGPYNGSIPKDTIEYCRQVLKHDVIRIAGVGRFSNPNEEVVFLRVDSPHLREIWWKPDFPIEHYGFEPHLSIYRGKDAKFADLVVKFISQENIELLCAEHRLVSHLPRQPDLFFGRTPRTKNLNRFTDSGRLHTTFLKRLRKLVMEYERNYIDSQTENREFELTMHYSKRHPLRHGNRH